MQSSKFAMGKAPYQSGGTQAYDPIHPYPKYRGRDKIADLLRRDVEHYRIKSFETFKLTTLIIPSVDAEEIYTTSGHYLGSDKYDFEVNGEDPKTLRVTLNAHFNPRIRYLGRWYPVARYLEELPSPPRTDRFPIQELTALEQQRADWDQQWTWWCSNGKTFKFLNLPSEIRELIYGFNLGHSILPYPFAKARGIPYTTSVGIATTQPDTALLHLTSQLYTEASHVLFKTATFEFGNVKLLYRMSRNEAFGARIQRLELKFSHEQFLRLFRFPGIEEFRSQRPGLAKFVRYMGLRELTLHIDRPSERGAIVWRDVACQKTVVDWILRSAVRWIGALRKVRVAGYAKTAQREEFEKQCGIERRGFLDFCDLKPPGYEAGTLREYDEWREDDGGVRLQQDEGDCPGDEDGEESEDELEFPPVCRCERSCDILDWTEDD